MRSVPILAVALWMALGVRAAAPVSPPEQVTTVTPREAVSWTAGDVESRVREFALPRVWMPSRQWTDLVRLFGPDTLPIAISTVERLAAGKNRAPGVAPSQ